LRILALEQERSPLDPVTASDLLRAEAQVLWELCMEGIVRSADFRADRHEAVLLLEADSLATASKALERLPLVRSGAIVFELIPLAPYDGFARLFAEGAR
jgi:hypothetical protein